MTNYRSFSKEQSIDIANTNVLIGPNNVGKSNFLRAIELFFSSIHRDQDYPAYDYNRDFPRGLLPGGRTSLTAVFQLDDSSEQDQQLAERYDFLRRRMKQPYAKRHEIPINLQFSQRGVATYSLFPGVSVPTELKISDDFQVWHREFIEQILNTFYVVYIPAEKELKKIFDRIVVEVVKQEIAEQLEDILDAIRHQADLVSHEINNTLSAIGMPTINIFFEPAKTFEELVSGFHMTVMDRSEGTLFEKSMGMQWLILATCISWVSLSLRRRSGLRCLWLVEEPESYLHPELFPKQRNVFEKIGENADVLYTTHSLGFVASDISRVHGVFFDQSNSVIEHFSSHEQAIRRIKKGLGTRFSDYFHLRENVIAVEGKSDIEYLQWFLKQADTKLEHSPQLRWPTLFGSDFVEFGGVVGLSGFVRANYQFIREEIAFVPMLDGDDAGKRAAKDLGAYFNGGKEISFNANVDYILLPNGLSIEGLFPNSYLLDFVQQFPSWFRNPIVDTEQRVVSFSLQDDKKSNFAKTAMFRAEKDTFASWSARWLNVCDALNV
ncbi:AAA family ATPase [Bradyrhizobium sp. INPA01-394B]|uniref:AAA family ATPase n=1 Tax=Bradyrhizobium campsiandrae TaxID=1729892 RepID=A0ABR7UF00_9BRAD|nr:AAA family ATPase [Bradyrhizobium campsiandrae]MBC9982534.1 AAA family ATPase [Bradyrhizobium campsiandrae]